MPRSGTRKCLHCGTFYHPNPRSKGRQKFCSGSACQRASKRASQQKWLTKPENRDYFRGPDNVRRVQKWRADNPGYSRRGTVSAQCVHATPALQDPLMTQPSEKKGKDDLFKGGALQELLNAQPVVLLGLIAHLSGTALQDDIVEMGHRLRQLGEDFLATPDTPQGAPHVISSVAQPPPLTPSTRAVQLDRPPPGT